MAYVKKLDRLMSLYIRARDQYCVVCGSSAYLNNGHYISRSFYNTRWNFENCNAQCARCNRMHEYDAEPYRQVMVDRYGEDGILKIRQLAHSGHKLSWEELEEIEKEIARRMSEL